MFLGERPGVLPYREAGSVLRADRILLAHLERPVHCGAAHQIVYADQDGTFHAVTLPSPDHHPNLVATRALLPTGTTVLSPRGYRACLGYAIVTAPSAYECEASLVAAVADVSVDIAPSR